MADAVMSMDIEFDEFMRMVNAGDRVYRQAGAAALNKAGRKVRTQVTRQAARRNQVPARAVKRHSVMGRANRMRMEVRNGVLLSIAARNLDPQQVGAAPGGTKPGPRGGVAVKGRTFESAFIAKDKGGRKRVFRRPGRRGLPKASDHSEQAPRPMVGRGGQRGQVKEPAIRNMKVLLKDLEGIMRAENQKGFEYMRATLPGELLWRLQRAAR